MSEITTTPEVLEVEAINGLALTTKDAIQTAFLPFAQQFEEWKEKAGQIIVSDVSQIEEMKAAREARLALVKVRTGADKVRQELKAESLKYGKAVQEVYNKIEASITPIEQYLEAQEKFKEVVEAKERAEKLNARMEQIREFPHVQSSEIAGLSDEMFNVFVKGLHDERDRRIAAEKRELEEQAERVRIAELHHERRSFLMENDLWRHLDTEAQAQNFGEMPEEDYQAYITSAKIKIKEIEQKAEAQRLENEKLKKEAELKEAAIKAEREKAEAERKAIEEKARIEREKVEAENRRIAAELKAKQDAEDKAKAEAARIEKERIAAEKKALKAPDKVKLTTLIAGITIEQPQLKSEEAQAAFNVINAKLEAFKVWANQQIESL